MLQIMKTLHVLPHARASIATNARRHSFVDVYGQRAYRYSKITGGGVRKPADRLSTAMKPQRSEMLAAT